MVPPWPDDEGVTDHFDTRGFLLERWGSYWERDVVRAYPKCRDFGPGNVVVWYDNYSWGDGRMRTWVMAPSIRAYNLGNWYYTQL